MWLSLHMLQGIHKMPETNPVGAGSLGWQTSQRFWTLVGRGLSPGVSLNILSRHEGAYGAPNPDIFSSRLPHAITLLFVNPQKTPFMDSSHIVPLLFPSHICNALLPNKERAKQYNVFLVLEMKYTKITIWICYYKCHWCKMISKIDVRALWE